MKYVEQGVVPIAKTSQAKEGACRRSKTLRSSMLDLDLIYESQLPLLIYAFQTRHVTT